MTTVVGRSQDIERRAHVYPWGIQIEVWRKVNTLTYPNTARSLPLDLFLTDPRAVQEAVPVDDDPTLETEALEDYPADGRLGGPTEEPQR
ncbi:MAG TPA: hypothetical protein VGD55_08440 [Acidothermaceae bacterium]